MKMLRNIIIGITLGITSLVPGASVGTMLLIFAVYEEFIDALDFSLKIAKNMFKSLFKPKDRKEFINAIPIAVTTFVKQQKDFFIPIFIACIVTIFAFSKLLTSLDKSYTLIRNFIFFGLVLASAPLVIYDILKGKGEFKTEEKPSNKKVKHENLKGIILIILTTALLCVLAYLSYKGYGLKKVELQDISVNSIIPAFLVGVVGIVAMVFPRNFRFTYNYSNGVL